MPLETLLNIQLRIVACLLALMALAVITGHAVAAESVAEAPLVIGQRVVHVFRAPLGAYTPAERAEGARQRILKAMESSGEGWTSIKRTEQGVSVDLDGKPMFVVLPGDARKLADESPDDLANAASRKLQQVWREAQERSDPRATASAAMRVMLAAVVLLLALTGIVKIVRWMHGIIIAHLADRVHRLPGAGGGSRMAALLIGLASRGCLAAGWLLALTVVFLFLVYSLDQFAHTRSISEGLSQSLTNLLAQVMGSVAGAVPGLFIAAIIFLVAWSVTQVSSAIFSQIGDGRLKVGMLDAHTAPATRRIVNGSLWLFALAMAYPYLPGSHTEAFKGLSVMVGLMVSIGASGLIGQMASGIMLVYTRALSLGDYVRIQEAEGTVTELGLLVTRLRTGMGEEVALPNALVLANLTRNFSRSRPGAGFILDTTITIGYDSPWRQVHAMLLEAAHAIPEIARDPAPYVVQTALSDFYVAYKLVVYAGADKPAARARVTSDLHASIQDVFNRNGVQIMSPHYYLDPAKPKTVAEADWYAPPATAPLKKSD